MLIFVPVPHLRAFLVLPPLPEEVRKTRLLSLELAVLRAPVTSAEGSVGKETGTREAGGIKATCIDAKVRRNGVSDSVKTNAPSVTVRKKRVRKYAAFHRFTEKKPVCAPGITQTQSSSFEHLRNPQKTKTWKNEGGFDQTRIFFLTFKHARSTELTVRVDISEV